MLLTVFAAGLGVPFILLAAAAGWFEDTVTAARRHTRAIRLVSGIALIAFGVLPAFGLIGSLSSRLAGIPGFEF